MHKARLLDLEGRTVAEMAISECCPRLFMAAAPKIKWSTPLEDPIMLDIKQITYAYERMAGDGVLIYRRETGPWG